jgi:hypothetical protein
MLTKKTQTLILCSLILVSAVFIWIKPCSANPIAIGMVEDGSALHNGENISMLYADVKINITRISDTAFIDLSGNYEIETNQTQNTTLAYVYPTMLAVGNLDMKIYMNDVEIEFTILTWHEIVESGFSEDLYEYTSQFADFACFNISLAANTSVNLQVISHNNFTLESAIYFQYNYIFGSARTFEKDTLERIHIHLVQERTFLSTSFAPDEYLSLSQNGITTDAIWEFNVSSIEDNKVQFSAQVNFLPISPVVILILF